MSVRPPPGTRSARPGRVNQSRTIWSRMTEICHSNLPCHGACCILRLGHPRCKNEPQTYLRCSAETRFFTSPLFLKCISDDPQNCLSALVILRSTSNVPPAKQCLRNRVPQTYLKESHFWEVPFQSEIVLDWLNAVKFNHGWRHATQMRCITCPTPLTVRFERPLPHTHLLQNYQRNL